MPRRRTTKKQKARRREIAGIIIIAAALLIAVAVYGVAKGIVMDAMKDVVYGVFGLLGYAFPVGVAIIGIACIAGAKKKISAGKSIMIAVGLLSVMSIIHLLSVNESFYNDEFLSYLAKSYEFGRADMLGGGALGALVLYPVHLFLGVVGSYICFIALLIVSVIVVANISVKEMSHDIRQVSKKAAVKAKESVVSLRERRSSELFVDNLENPEESNHNLYVADLEEDAPTELPRRGRRPELEEDSEPALESPSAVYIEPVEHVLEDELPRPSFDPPLPADEDGEETIDIIPGVEDEYIKPSLELLKKPDQKKRRNVLETGRKTAARLEDTLSSFGVKAKVVDVSRGPVVTRFELAPAPGVKIARIVQLSDDIALNLAAPRVRIEAPIPGKAAVGIEVPNQETDSVNIYDLLSSPEYAKISGKSPLTFALGQDLAGKNVYADIGAMPHMLIAGATGSGKSVCINTIIVSLLMNATPDELRLIMVDPKVVELSVYNDIPHLMIPVVTDPKKAASALNWAVAEMTQRYKNFAKKGAKDLKRYNASLQEGEEKMPYLVIIIDELADLMLVCQNEVEDSICRIAQLGRACGIHLVIATQRPSVDVITGIIKANVPSRIAFAVSSQVDSRTILDMAGAEKLLGRGDMLYYPTGAPKPLRVQGAFVQDSEVEAITSFLRERTNANYSEEVIENIEAPSSSAGEGEEREADPLLPRAIEVGLEFGQVSISMIQRRLRVGYARAARLLDEMEVRGLVSPFEGSKPRQMQITREEYELLKAGENEEQNA